jgi:hypothetical protein
LNRIVRERNEASHGNVANVSGPSELIAYADFIEMLVVCASTILRSEIVAVAQRMGAAKEVALVVKKYSGGVYGSRAAVALRLEPGQTYFAGKGLIYEVTLEELRIGKAQVDSIDAVVGTEFGMRLNEEIPEGSTLFTL